MNTEYVWWVVVLLLVAGGAIAFLVMGRVPEIGDDPDLDPATDSRTAQSAPVSTTVPGPGVPTSTSDTP